MTRIKVRPEQPEKLKTEAVALFLFEDGKNEPTRGRIDKKLKGRIASLINRKKYRPKKLSSRTIDTMGALKAETVILVGLGKKGDLTLDTMRRAAAKAAAALRSMGTKNFALSVEGLGKKSKLKDADLSQAAAEGIILSLYRFTQYQKKPENSFDGLNYAVISQKSSHAKVKSAVSAAQKVCSAVFLARDLQNHPGNRATPSFLAEQARKACRKAGVRCRVIGPREMERLKMGLLLSVARGSAEPPKFIVMEYMKGKKSEKPIVLIGKGLTFDTGGISLKPSQNMEEMKFDMSGGAAVIATMYAAALLKMKKNIVGLVPASENMPGSRATKPGDIIRSMSGTTVEILNTDAEGRLILADALAYAKKYKPALVIDLATLTGSIMVALGSHATGLFGNDEKLIAALKEAGERTGERCWPMPLWDVYRDQIKSKVADLKNIGGRYGGSITAAAFLEKFTDYPWAHLDIAGTAFGSRPQSPYIPAGGAGLGVRQLIEFLRSR